MNTVIQGSAADLIKVAMLRIAQAMQDQNWASEMILQVHDELIWDAVPEEMESLAGLAVTHMKEALTLSVPLVVELKAGQTWESMVSWGKGEHA